MKKHIFYDLWLATDKAPQVKLEYDDSKKIKDQILYQYKDVRLLNVSKSYCDGNYQGVWFLFLVDTDFLKIFKPIDGGFDESVADNLESVLSTKHFRNIVNGIQESIDYNKTIDVDTFIFEHNNNHVKCDKVYIEGEYAFSNYHTNNVVQRGAYSEYSIFSDSGVNIFQCDGKDNNCIINYYKDKSVPNLANTITLQSTSYSTIKYENSI